MQNTNSRCQSRGLPVANIDTHVRYQLCADNTEIYYVTIMDDFVDYAIYAEAHFFIFA